MRSNSLKNSDLTDKELLYLENIIKGYGKPHDSDIESSLIATGYLYRDETIRINWPMIK